MTDTKRVEFEAWAVMLGSMCVGRRVFQDEDELESYMNHLRDMSYSREAKAARVRVTVEVIE